MKLVPQRLLTLAGVALVASGLAAQLPIVSQNHVIGWVTPSSTINSPGAIDQQLVSILCKPATRICTNVLSHKNPYWAGGTAYDPRYQTVWNCDGSALLETRLSGLFKCKARCKMTPAFGSTTAVVSGLAIADGLAFSDKASRLFHLEMPAAGGSFGIREYVFSSPTCVPKAGVYCRQLLPKGAIAAGLAYDETRDVLYVSVSVPNVLGTFTSVVYVVKRPVPGATCKILCNFKVMVKCSLRPVVGLGFDCCSRILYVTDGVVTQGLRISIDAAGRPCLPKVIIPCCKKSLAGPYRGLAVVPGWKISKIGMSCSSPICPSCPNMINQTFGGDPSIGNPDFGMSLTKAPSPAFAFPLLSLTPCGQGWNSPPFCKPIYPPQQSMIIGPAIPMTALPTCNGAATFAAGIPVSSSLCGKTLCAQWLVLCVKPQPLQFGLGVSHALQLTIAGS